MIKFSHIGQLHNVVQTMLARRSFGVETGVVAFRGTVKLHGSNASVVCLPEGLQPQSRNRTLELGTDNLGFAGFVLDPSRAAAIRTLEGELRAAIGITELGADRPLVLFGEWIGPGVQKRVGICDLPARQWVLFAVATLDEGAEHKRWFPLPEFGERYAEQGIYSVADAPSWTVSLDFGDRAALELGADAIEELTNRVDGRCPWAARFGIEGVGEGIVWTPQGAHFGDSDLLFKSKGKQHQITRRDPGSKRKAAALDPEQLANVEVFVIFAVTEARLEQGFEVLAEAGLSVEMRNLGAYLKWLGNDVRRECAAELEVNGLEWGQVSRAVTNAGKSCFRKRLEQFAF